MSDILRRQSGRPTGALGLSHAAWGWITLWAGSSTVLGLAAATVEPIVELGPGAVVLTGAGGAGAVALALGASLWGGGVALAALSGMRPIPGLAFLNKSRSSAQALQGSEAQFRELVLGLAAQLGRLDEKLNTAIAIGNLAVKREGSGTPAMATGETVAVALEQLRREQHAAHARAEAEAEKLEARSKARVEALSDAVLPRVDRLDRDMARLDRALIQGDTRLREFEGQVFDIIRARDTSKLLRRLDAEATELFDRLVDADERRYATAEAWRADYAEWRTRINRFWDVLRGYRTSVEQPFAVTEADINHANGVPDGALFAAADMRFRYKMLIVVNERHVNFRVDAFSFNEKKGSAPDPSVPLTAEVRWPPAVAG